MGLVVLISMSRYILLKTWPDFAESSEAANKQVLIVPRCPNRLLAMINDH